MSGSIAPSSGWRAHLGPAVAAATVLAFGVGAALQAAHAGHTDQQIGVLAHWLRDGALAWPLALLVATVGLGISRRLVTWAGLTARPVLAELAWVLPMAVAYAAAVVPAGMAHTAMFPGASASGVSSAPGSAGSAVAAAAHGGAAHSVGGVPASGALDAATTIGVTNAAVALLTGIPLLLLTGAVLRAIGGWRTAFTRWRSATTGRRRALAGVALGALTATLVQAPAGATLNTPAAQTAVAACGAASADRTYDVAAINVHVPYNRWGQGNPDGQVYVLQGDKSAVKNWDKPLGTTGDNRRLRPRPLVIRANEGECVRVNFTNELDETQGEGLPTDPRASMSVRGIPFDVQTSGGSHAGYNDDSTVSNNPGANSTTYYWSAPAGGEGIYFFNDTAIPAGSEADGGSIGNGLYGAFVVEPAGSTWRDPVSGKRLYSETGGQSGELYIDAVITPPTGRVFRESVQLAQDELPLTSAFAFNFGSEPEGAREAAGKCPDCAGEETSLSSWTYGDPGMVKLASGRGPWRPGTPEGTENCGLGTAGFTADSCFTSNVTHSYVHDPIKFRYGLASVYETHVFHMHAHTWLAEPDDVGKAGPTPSKPSPSAPAESNTIDSQTFGPMEMFTADLLFGAGSKAGTVGDSIFHCHLYPHFADGFWSLLRVHDVLEDGTGSTPDGIKVPALLPIAGSTQPPAPTAENPGFPRFIPGKVGWRAPQPPLGVSDNGVPATRYVAGKPLDETSPAVAVEKAVANRLSGGRSVPGAPFRDACPQGAREVTYNVSVIQTDIVYNERGDHDTQGRILVLDSDVADVLAGRKKAEPLFARVNAGDCVNWNLTNRLPNWFGNDAFVKLTQTNMFGQHIHLMKFDVLASDGSSNGWNYQQAAFSRDQADFNTQIQADPAKCTTASCRLPYPASWDPTKTSSGLAPGQTIHERWYADYELRTAFTHDHHFAAVDQNRGQYGALVVEPVGMDFRDPRAASAWRQPINDPAHGPVCGQKCEGTAVGTVMDVIGPGADDDFRDFGIAIADYVSLTKKGGNPRLASDVINPPSHGPEAFPSEDPGVRAINYRNAPLELRRSKNGQAVDPAYVFSSHVFGDPQTPVLQTYQGDNVRLRVIQGSHEEQHVLNVHGMKWKAEPNDPGSPWVNAQTVGISEAFNFEVPLLNCPTGQDCRGDYLYGSGSIDDMATGMWGLLRVNGGKVPSLPTLPDNPQTRTGTVPAKSATALAPPARQTAGNPCPAGAPVRKYSVVAMQAKITYNRYGDHDPYGLVYALASDEAAIKAGRNPEPLVLRANEGDCIDVTLTNKLTTAFQQHRGEGDAPVVGEGSTTRTPGLRVSMHPGMLRYDVRGSDGAAIGFNRDQTVAPGASMAYRWFAEDVTPGEIGAVNLTDFGDVRGHRHHGLFAGLVVEPKGSTWHDPVSGRPDHTGPSADIRVKGAKDFRENVVFFQDGLNLRRANGSVIADVFDHDVSDHGERAFNYRNAPFRHRLGFEPATALEPNGQQMGQVYDSHAHGDPDTPIYRAYSGDEVRVRILQGADKSRQHGFQLDGHSFKPQPDDPQGRETGTLTGINVGSAVNAQMGQVGVAGDYLYGTSAALAFRSGGLWGFQRVYPKPAAAGELLPTARTGADDPRAGGHPVLPLELDSVRARVFNDVDRDGVKDAAEPFVAGATVAKIVSGAVAASGTSAADGFADLSVRAGSHALRVTPPAGYAVSKAPASVSTAGNNAVVTINVALRKL